jgi:hypothetical protein
VSVSAGCRCGRSREILAECIGNSFHDTVAAVGRTAYYIYVDILVFNDLLDDGGGSSFKELLVVLVGIDCDVGDGTAGDRDGNLRCAAETCAGTGIGAVLQRSGG